MERVYIICSVSECLFLRPSPGEVSGTFGNSLCAHLACPHPHSPSTPANIGHNWGEKMLSSNSLSKIKWLLQPYVCSASVPDGTETTKCTWIRRYPQHFRSLFVKRHHLPLSCGAIRTLTDFWMRGVWKLFSLTSKLKKIPQDLPKGEVPAIWVWLGSTGFKGSKPISFRKQRKVVKSFCAPPFSYYVKTMNRNLVEILRFFSLTWR